MKRVLALCLMAGCQAAPPSDSDPSVDTDPTGGGGGDDTGDAPDTDGGPTTGTSPRVDPTCTDGAYAEVLADPDASLASAKASFSAADPSAFLLDALDVRFPIGAYLFEGGLDHPVSGDCFTQFTSAAQRKTASGMLDAASTLVHECGHFFDIGTSTQRGQTYHIRDDLKFTCNGGSYQSTPARSRIQKDDWASLRPQCPEQGSHGCDSYAQVYLDGSPTNSTFESGDQGLDMVMEEAVQYVNSLATDYAFADQLGAGSRISAKDGILTYLWYIERYLHLMRTTEPGVYADVMASACWRDTILTVWGRAWLYLDAAKPYRSLGIDHADLLELVQDPDLLDEIQRVRDASGCD